MLGRVSVSVPRLHESAIYTMPVISTRETQSKSHLAPSKCRRIPKITISAERLLLLMVAMSYDALYSFSQLTFNTIIQHYVKHAILCSFPGGCKPLTTSVLPLLDN